MLKLFFLCLTVVTITASSDFPVTAFDGDACYENTLLESCIGAITVPTDFLDLNYDCALLTYESKCFEKYCSVLPAEATVWKPDCVDVTSHLKPTPNLPKLPSDADVTTTAQASANTRAPPAGGTTSPSSTSSARVGLQNSGGSSAPLRQANANMGALAVIILLWKFM